MAAREMSPHDPASGEVIASCPQEDRQDKRAEGEANEDELGGCEAPESQLDP